jgi:hypothetical protein
LTGRRDLRALVRGLVLVVAAVVVAGPASEAALSGQWCGTITTTDRLPSVTGRSIRVVLTFPSDGADRSTELAPRISADVDEIAAWWRGQDAAREPRFDRAPFPCGLQADIFVLRLPGSTASLTPGATRGDRIVDAVYAANGRSQYEKVLVYHDGPVDNADSCGEGAGSPDGAGIAIVYLSACAGVPSAMVAAHELLHAFGALAFSGPPHACPDSRGHPCDSMHDLLYPYAPQTQLGSLSLDVGRDDYYGHSGSWPDTQDSGWLRLVSQQVRLTLAIVGLGSVESDVPGVACAAGCATDWDAGSEVSLEPVPRAGQRFVRWSGSCTGSGSCDVSLQVARSVTALFAPARFGLVVSVSGRGAVTGAGGSCRSARCARTATSYSALRLRATPAAGWRLAGWSGGCTGRAPTCTLPMKKATAVRVRFVRR